MTARFFALFTAVVLLLPAVLLSLVTVAPGTEFAILAGQGAFGAGALLFRAIGYCLQRAPAERWANRMPALRWALFLAALTASVVVVWGEIA